MRSASIPRSCDVRYWDLIVQLIASLEGLMLFEKHSIVFLIAGIESLYLSLKKPSIVLLIADSEGLCSLEDTRLSY
jgi:hypothetical protein